LRALINPNAPTALPATHVWQGITAHLALRIQSPVSQAHTASPLPVSVPLAHLVLSAKVRKRHARHAQRGLIRIPVVHQVVHPVPLGTSMSNQV
jgi:hypothetical protein